MATGLIRRWCACRDDPPCGACGAFRTPDDAEAQRARLSLMGVEARVTEREQAGRTVYRVRVGPFQNKDAADRVKDRLDGNGFDSALVRVQR